MDLIVLTDIEHEKDLKLGRCVDMEINENVIYKVVEAIEAVRGFFNMIDLIRNVREWN